MFHQKEFVLFLEIPHHRKSVSFRMALDSRGTQESGSTVTDQYELQNMENRMREYTDGSVEFGESGQRLQYLYGNCFLLVISSSSLPVLVKSPFGSSTSYFAE